MQDFTNSTKIGHNLHQCRKFTQLRCQKGADTNIHNCLVGYSLVAILYNALYLIQHTFKVTKENKPTPRDLIISTKKWSLI